MLRFKPFYLDYIIKDRINFLLKNQTSDFNIPREEMPQIARKDIPEFLEYLSKKSIQYKVVKTNIHTIRLIQLDINTEKVKTLVNIPESGQVMISNDLYILDGNHRFISEYIRNFNNSTHNMEVLRINLPIKDLIEITHNFDKSFTKNIHENF